MLKLTISDHCNNAFLVPVVGVGVGKERRTLVNCQWECINSKLLFVELSRELLINWPCAGGFPAVNNATIDNIISR